MIAKLQHQQDLLAEMIDERLKGWLAGQLGVDTEVIAQANEFIAILGAALRDIPALQQGAVRHTAAKMLFDLAVASFGEGNATAAEHWRQAASVAAEGTKLAVIAERAVDFPAWFVEAQRIQWMYMAKVPEAELDEAEEAFLRRYQDDPAALRYGL